ncbi:Endoplasmic reticulum zinc transporter [Scheffersomyces spartinae]|uniref:Endoplasmic reticulum zinc transporter n=1 Tax=Scheffersomyces spartinae TaxID=45513 RepID=A0A9P7V5K6_9ASCO|nr:Endoplasmic reticulum zinc transporter [Scheffersomyces spartinae]KAG7191623.1 Endoplasmic reticulum zinc transporter [Scheffersomyces spartinae]
MHLPGVISSGGGGKYSGTRQYPRRYSNNVLTTNGGGLFSGANNTSPVVYGRTPPSARPRPRSAIFLTESNYSIAEDGPLFSPLDSATARFPGASPSPNIDASKRHLIYRLDNGSGPILIPTPLPIPVMQRFGPGGGGGSEFDSGASPVAMSPPRNTARSPARSPSPIRNSWGGSRSPIRKSKSPVKYLPFNFQLQEMGHSHSGSISLKPAHRKGHKYKHSSVSMNLFQEPPPALSVTQQPLAIAELFPVPNLYEALSMVKPQQKLRLLWSVFHLTLAAVILIVGFKFKFSPLSTLAHLVFYDALGSSVVVFVDIMSNFEVWNTSSIVYPFGLGRLEVLVGFGLATSLIMVGADLISHSIEEFVMTIAMSTGAHDEVDLQHQHLSHHIHDDHSHNPNLRIYVAVLMATVAITLSSQFILKRDKFGQMMSTPEGIVGSKKNKKINQQSILDSGNKEVYENSSKKDKTVESVRSYSKICKEHPTHFLTLCYSFYLLVIPFIPTDYYKDIAIDINEATEGVVALMLCYIGWRVAKTLGGMLLLSYPYSDYDYHVTRAKILQKTFELDSFKNSYLVDKLFITKFNLHLYIVGMLIRMKGASIDDESRVRFEISRVINKVLESTDPNAKTEITIDINRF